MSAARVLLRPARPDDRDRLLRWINDRELVVLSAPFHPVTEAEHDAWFAGVLSGREDRRFFMIDTTPDARTIGSCQLLNIHPVHRSADLQIRIGTRSAWGQGFGTAAVQALVEYAFCELGLHRVSLQVFAHNERAIGAYRKAGFAVEGTARQAAFIEGRFVDVVHMGILDGER